MMNNINAISFKGYVPKSQYSGVPKLSKEAINGLNELKALVKQADERIIETESLIAQTEYRGGIVDYLKEKLSLLNKYKSCLTSEMECTRKYNEYDSKYVSKIQKDLRAKSNRIDTTFDEIG